jgi:hypothetical protein
LFSKRDYHDPSVFGCILKGRLADPENIRVDTILFDDLLEGLTFKTALSRGPSNVTAVLLEHMADIFNIELLHDLLFGFSIGQSKYLITTEP